MIEMRVGQKQGAEFAGFKPERLLVQDIGIPSLVHAAINDQLCVICRQMKTRPGNFSRRTQEPDLHLHPARIEKLYYLKTKSQFIIHRRVTVYKAFMKMFAFFGKSFYSVVLFEGE